jgi:hypothetical protein
MTKVPIPAALALQISNNAVRYARENMHGYAWSDKSLQALQPLPGEGTVGIKTTLKYLMKQERGFQPYLMWWVAGRTVPLSCKQGDGPHFRRGGHVGEPGMVNIPHQGQVWRDARWRHPGVAPKNFMQQGLQRAIAEAQPQIKAWARRMLGGPGR